MKGFLLEAVGDEPRLVDVPEPVAADGQTVVQVLAAGVNPVDLLQAADPARTVPRIVGNEAVVVLDGDRAYAERTVAPHGSIAERAVVDPALAIPLPDDVADEAALAIGIAGIAAWMTLNRVVALRPGETALILGATGAVGRNVVQIARLLGAGRVVAAGRDTKRLTALRELGADATVPFDALRGRTLLTHSNQLTDPAPKREAFLWLLDRLRAGELSVSTRVLSLADAAEAWALQRTSPGTKLVLRP